MERIVNDTHSEFEAAFREAAGDNAGSNEAPPAPEVPTGEAAPAEPDQTGADVPPTNDPETADQPDIWAGATPEQIAAFRAAEEKAQTLEQRVRSDDGRVFRYQRDRDVAQRKLETLVTAAQKDGEDLRALVASDEWKKAKADFGDDLGPVFNALERLTSQTADASERMQQVSAVELDALEAENFNLLDEQAPDWRALLGRQDFSPWLQSQPKPWQDAFALNRERLVDPTSAKELVDRFRAYVFVAENPQPQPAKTPEVQLDPRRARQLDGARTASSRTPVVADPGGGSFEAEFMRAAQIKERQAAAR